MNDLMVFNNPEFGAIRSMEIDGEGWFVGVDIAKALGYAKPQGAVARHVDEDDSLIWGVTDNLGREQQTKVINESGVFTLIIMSDLPSAKKFKRWVTSEVLPSIRKTGTYNAPPMTTTEIVAHLANNAVEMEKRIDNLESKLETTLKVFSQPNQDHWKADIENAIDTMVETYNLSAVAFRGRLYKELESNGVMLQSRLNRLKMRLKKQGVTYKERQAISKLDIISRDKQLRVIFEGILKKYQAIFVERTA